VTGCTTSVVGRDTRTTTKQAGVPALRCGDVLEFLTEQLNGLKTLVRFEQQHEQEMRCDYGIWVRMGSCDPDNP
jgi:hypothetical protein